MIIYLILHRIFGFWRLYKLSNSSKRIIKSLFLPVYTYYCTAQSSFIGHTARIESEPNFPHGQKGVFISGGTIIGKGCTIFQNVTIGSIKTVGSKHYGSPEIGNNVLIGANAVVIGKIKIGDNVKIAAGAAVFEDIPDNSTVFCQPCIVKNHCHKK